MQVVVVVVVVVVGDGFRSNGATIAILNCTNLSIKATVTMKMLILASPLRLQSVLQLS